MQTASQKLAKFALNNSNNDNNNLYNNNLYTGSPHHESDIQWAPVD